MDRPRDIGRFAVLAAIACLVNAGATLLLVDFNLRAGAGSALGVAIVLGLVAWVVLARSLIARVILTIWLAFLTGAGIASYGLLIAQHRTSVMNPAVHALSLVTILANILALYFLWTAASTAWLQRQADAS